MLETDASDEAVGSQLRQFQTQTHCIVRATHHFRHALLGAERVRYITDHHTLQWFLGFKNIEGQLGRWLEELSRSNLEVSYRPGVKH